MLPRMKVLNILNIFKNNHFKSENVCAESSKVSGAFKL